MNAGPLVFIELHRSDAGCYARTSIEGAPDDFPRAFVGAHGTREAVISDVTSWSFGWFHRLRDGRP